MQIEWKDGYKLGDAVIDEQHQHLFALANAFLAAKDSDAQTQCAMRLYKHTREHFGHEERLMRELHFPDYQAHVDSHNQLISRLNAVSDTIAKGSLTEQDVQAFMTDWALHHIPLSDAKLSQYLATR